MAGLACGNAFGLLPNGHAPEAGILDVSITVPQGESPASRWTTDDPSMLNAIQILRASLTEDESVHVLNISFDGWSDPWDPVTVALDDSGNQSHRPCRKENQIQGAVRPRSAPAADNRLPLAERDHERRRRLGGS